MVLLYHHLRTFGLWYLALALTGLYFAWPTVDLYRALHGRGVTPDHPSIVMLGDSHTEFVNWQILMRCPNIANSGVGGNDTTQILQRLPEVLSMKPKLVILMAGTNDARRYVPPSQTISNLQAIKQIVADHGIEFVSLTPPPLPSRGAVQTGAVSIPFTEADLLDDKIHLRRSGYAKWRDAIAPLVRKFC